MFLLNRIVTLVNWITLFALGFSYLSTFVNPASFIWFAYFGIIFPYLFIANVFFLVYWLIFSKRKAIYSVIITVIGFAYFDRSFNFYSCNSRDLKGEKSVILDYNVRLFDLYNWTENNKTKKEIFSFLDKQDADIYCFQEFFHQDSSEKFVTRDTLAKFLKAKNYAEAYTHKLHNRQYFGLAVFTVYPILNKGIITFPNDINNNAMWVDVKRNHDTLRIFNTHLASLRFQSKDYEAIGIEYGKGFASKKEKEQRILGRMQDAFFKRVKQTSILLNEIKKSPFPVVLCGDFNDTPVSYCYSRFNEILNDAFRISGYGWGGTYAGGVPFIRIDYIWHSDNINSTNFKVHDKKLSDHYPISCTIAH